MDNKIKLKVLGFSLNQTQSGIYGLFLAEENGLRRLMVVVGAPEAQSIAFNLQNLKPPRPLTHDLLKSILDDFAITLLEVEIYKFEEGIFFSKLVLKQGSEITLVDSRTSDAIAVALRTNAPIYTSEEIMQKYAVVQDESNNLSHKNEDEDDKATINYSLLDLDELEAMLDDAIDRENYELASILRDELEKKGKHKGED